jgi:glycine/D-amino acid oxidase-like deaminating enzyme
VVRDFIIIGQGIAGSALAFQLIKAGKSVLVVDEESKNTSSKIAAGLFNPIVFKRITFAWRAEEAINNLITYYKEIEHLTKETIIHLQPMYRIHGSEGEFKSWVNLKNQVPFNSYLGEEELPTKRSFFNQPFGSAMVNNTGFVNTNLYLSLIRNWLIQKDSYLNAVFNYDELKLKNEGVDWNGISAKKIIFCEGFVAEKNPFFSYLPFKNAKGEELLIECKDIAPEVFNGSIYGVPQGNNLFKIGSTFAWNQPNQNPTKEARDEIENKLKKLISVSYKVINQNAGIRPSVSDRRPFVGMHPKHNQVGIFNGFGTKGISLSPLLAKEFVAHLIYKEDLHVECDIQRYNKLLIS